MLLDNIYVINLDKSIERMNKIKKLFNEYDIKFKRISAVYGKDLNKKQIKENTTSLCNFFCSYGIIGCAMSHLKIWKQLIDDKLVDYYIIMEDDAIIDDNFKTTISSIQDLIDEKKISFDLLSLYCYGPFNCKHHKNIITIKNYKIGKPFFPTSTASYIISKPGAKKLISKIYNKIAHHIDLQIAFHSTLNDIEYYSLQPNLVKINENNKTSTLGSKSTSIIFGILKFLNLNTLIWHLNHTSLSINQKIDLNPYLIIMIFILLLDLIFFKSVILAVFIILDLAIYLLFSN